MKANRFILFFLGAAMCLGAAAKEPASVFLVAGQSNADGRAPVSELPQYIKDNGYRHLRYANVTNGTDGHFVLMNFGKRFAFCDVTNYLIDQCSDKDFYVVKCTYGGTAIAPDAAPAKRPVWYADPAWLQKNRAYRGDIHQGKSLTLALTEGLGACAENTLSRLPEKYDVKAILWHQGESDRSRGDDYYVNFKTMIQFMRDEVYKITGDKKDKTLPFICGTVSRASTQYSAKVEEAQRRVAKELPNVYLLELDGVSLLPDILHFDAKGTEYLGQQMFNRLVDLKLVKGKKVESVKPVHTGYFPDGARIPAWFADTAKVDVDRLGKKYVVTDYGVRNDSAAVQTEALQAVIDRAAADGGGVVVIPRGMFVSGSLFFRKGTHLHVEDGGELRGIDAISHYKIIQTRLEGRMIKYFAALVNADGADGFTITGKGTINGNGRRFWEEFWLRRKVLPDCTNLEALRPRLVYISNSTDVTVQDVNLFNSGFWTNHLYRCDRVRYLDCRIVSPIQGDMRAPSSDGIDLDICNDVLVRGCYINVCDDGVCLKGGKGTYVDRDSTSGANSNIIVENCIFGPLTNAGITFGSEAWDCRNIILRDCRFDNSDHAVLFKMRPDTPQKYGYVLIENCTGSCKDAVEISTWSQFHAPVDRPDMPVSRVSNVTVRDLDLKCRGKLLKITRKHNFGMRDFTFRNIKAATRDGSFDTKPIHGATVKNVSVTRLSADDPVFHWAGRHLKGTTY